MTSSRFRTAVFFLFLLASSFSPLQAYAIGGDDEIERQSYKNALGASEIVTSLALERAHDGCSSNNPLCLWGQTGAQVNDYSKNQIPFDRYKGMNGFTSTNAHITLGADYALARSFRLGLFVSDLLLDVHNKALSQSALANNVAGGLYFHFQRGRELYGPGTGFFLDGTAWVSRTLGSNVSQKLNNPGGGTQHIGGDLSIDLWRLAFRLGYDYWATNSLTLTPFVGINLGSGAAAIERRQNLRQDPDPVADSSFSDIFANFFSFMFGNDTYYDAGARIRKDFFPQKTSGPLSVMAEASYTTERDLEEQKGDGPHVTTQRVPETVHISLAVADSVSKDVVVGLGYRLILSRESVRHALAANAHVAF